MSIQTLSDSDQLTSVSKISTSWGDAEIEESSDTDFYVNKDFVVSVTQSQRRLENEIASLHNMVGNLQQSLKYTLEMLTTIIANQQTTGMEPESRWKTTDPLSVQALNWIVKQIQGTGENSILPALLGLKWKSEFPSTAAPWVTEKKADRRKKGIKCFVKEYGNGILSVEDTKNHVTAKILFNP